MRLHPVRVMGVNIHIGDFLCAPFQKPQNGKGRIIDKTEPVRPVRQSMMRPA